MKLNFNIVDESINDIPVTEEQIAAQIIYNTDEKVDIKSLQYILVYMLEGTV